MTVRFYRESARLAALLGLIALGGCSWLPFGGKGKEAVCPAAVILRPLAQTAVFNKPGTGRRPTDVAFYGILSEVDPKCARDGNTLHVAMDVIIAAERAPASKGSDVPLNYFIAIVAPDQSIISKRSFSVTVQVPQAAKRAGVTDHIEEAIPLADHPPEDLSIVLGFQQSPEAIDFYQHFRGR